MSQISGARRSSSFLLLLIPLSLQLAPVFSDESKSASATKGETHSSSSSTGSAGSAVIIVLVVIAAVATVSFFLFKLWQKKKRDEQYARLLKLFEEDDQLELELELELEPGLRD